jgi:hypothetical protein
VLSNIPQDCFLSRQETQAFITLSLRIFNGFIGTSIVGRHQRTANFVKGKHTLKYHPNERRPAPWRGFRIAHWLENNVYKPSHKTFLGISSTWVRNGGGSLDTARRQGISLLAYLSAYRKIRDSYLGRLIAYYDLPGSPRRKSSTSILKQGLSFVGVQYKMARQTFTPQCSKPFTSS